MKSEEYVPNPDIIFRNLEYILNYSKATLVNRKEVHILWMIRTENDTVKGFAKIDTKVIPFRAYTEPEGELEIKLGPLWIVLDADTVKKAVQEAEQR